VKSWHIRTGKWEFDGADVGRLGVIKNALWNQLTDKIGNIVQNASEDCEKKPEDKTEGAVAAEAGCLDSLLVEIATSTVPFYQNLRSKMTEFGETAISDRIAKLDKCLPSYTASGNLEGPICHLDHPFKLHMTGQLSLDVQFNPASALSGEVQLIMAETDACTWTGGQGSYIVHPPEEGGMGVIILELGGGTISCPEGSTSFPFHGNLFAYITPLSERPASCGP
jgi:hypothetical protein